MRSATIRAPILAVVMAATFAAMAAGPVAATDGWLDRSFSGNGWVRLEEPDLPPWFVPREEIEVRAGAAGSVAVARRYFPDTAYAEVDALLLTGAGEPSLAFNGGQWRTFLFAQQSPGFMAFYTTSSGGVLGAHWNEGGVGFRVHELGASGATTRSVTVGLSNGDVGRPGPMLRLPGGSFRTCVSSGAQYKLLGLTPALNRDPAVGPNGERVIDFTCFLIGSDTSGHLYFAERTDEGRPGLGLGRTSSSGTTDVGWAGNGRTLLRRPGFGIDLPEVQLDDRPDFGTVANPLVVLPDGSMLIAARVSRDSAPDRWSAAVIKVTPDGLLDPEFGNDGIRAFAPADGQSRLLAMAVDASGRPVVSVVYNYADGRTRAFLARLTDAGRFDASFGRSGLVRQTYGAVSIAIDGSGRILTGAWDGHAVIVARRNG